MTRNAYTSDRDAAEITGKSPRTIQRWCQNGRIKGAVKVGRTWQIPLDAIRNVTPEETVVRAAIDALTHVDVAALHWSRATRLHRDLLELMEQAKRVGRELQQRHAA